MAQGKKTHGPLPTGALSGNTTRDTRLGSAQYTDAVEKARTVKDATLG